MKHLVSTWLLPPSPWAGPRAKPYPSRFKMTEEEARSLGAVAIVPGTTEEREEVQHQSAGHDGVQPPRL